MCIRREVGYACIIARCGAHRGWLLESLLACAAVQVNINVECTFVKDMLRGDDAYEMRLKYLAQNAEQYPYKEDD